ncbi:MAG: hypothetical protein JJ879_04280 [Sneathiella sp.]|nr:hypothetical protein [Sneathiella sp.]
MHNDYENIVHWLLMHLGHALSDQVPLWVHSFLHVIVFWAPLAISTLLIIAITIKLYRKLLLEKIQRHNNKELPTTVIGSSVFSFIIRNTLKQQALLIFLGITVMPVLYLILELPKIIINDVINASDLPISFLGWSLSQNQLLFTLSGVFLSAISIGGGLKYMLNVYKGRVGEHLLRRLRLNVYKSWRNGSGSRRRTEIIPLITQELEPIGGFASDVFSLPVFQGGTFITILFFMFMQDPILGAAALTLLPFQLFLIPKLQKRVNKLARLRVSEIRSLGGELGDQSSHHIQNREGILVVSSHLRRLERIRQKIHKTKFFMKAINNFLTALTPFFFYSIGGYLVIENQLTIGALIAVIAAHKEFSNPLKELFKYYQNAADVTIRYNETIKFLRLKAYPTDHEEIVQKTG